MNDTNNFIESRGAKSNCQPEWNETTNKQKKGEAEKLTHIELVFTVLLEAFLLSDRTLQIRHSIVACVIQMSPFSVPSLIAISKYEWTRNGREKKNEVDHLKNCKKTSKLN